MFRGGGCGGAHFHTYYRGSSSYDEDTVYAPIITLIICLIGALIALCVQCTLHNNAINPYKDQIDANIRENYIDVTCKYDEKITTGYTQITGLDNEYAILGDADNLVDNKMVLKGVNNTVVGYIDNTTNVISEEEHSIIIDDECKLIVVSGYNTAKEVYDYKFYTVDGTYIGRAEFSKDAEAGLIYDINDKAYVLFESYKSSNTYHLHIHRTDVLDTRVILLINGIYISDWMKGEAV